MYTFPVFTKAMNLAQKRYNRLFKIFKDEPYLSEGTTIVSDAGRETQFYHDVVEMLENGSRKQSEGEWETIPDYSNALITYRHICGVCGCFYKDIRPYGHKYCHECGAKMKGGAE